MYSNIFANPSQIIVSIFANSQTLVMEDQFYKQIKLIKLFLQDFRFHLLHLKYFHKRIQPS